MKTLATIIAALALPQAALALTPSDQTIVQTCPATTPAEIDGLFQRFAEAWATRDPEVVTALFTAEPVLLPTLSNTPRTNADGVRDYFTSFLRNRPVARIDTGTTEIDCHTASRVGTWTVTLTDPATGSSRDVHARYSFIYRFEDGGWKIDHLHSSVMPEAAVAAGH